MVFHCIFLGKKAIIITLKVEPALFFFTIAKEPVLTVSNLQYAIYNSISYKWKNNMFEKFQEIATEGCRASAAFVIKNESYTLSLQSKLGGHSQ